MKKAFKQAIAVFVALLLPFQGIGVAPALAQVLPLPAQTAPSLVTVSPVFVPAVLRGLKVDPQNPFHFNFVLDNGQSRLAGENLKSEGTKLIKYFLASLTLPENDLWVNLSPYEKDRIIPNEFGQTEMGRQLLSEDYLLKKLSASLLHPDAETGKKFWDKIRKITAQKLGTTDVSMDTFNRIWIMPDKAVVYQDQGTAFIGETHLKVLLEADYVALSNQKDSAESPSVVGTGRAPARDKALEDSSTQIFRDEVLPVIEKEVNEGENFASLRQIYHSLILASWYKRTLKQSLLSQVYVDRKKVAGVESDDQEAKQKIYEQYLETFRKGVYNLIREEQDAATGEMIPRKYFSGGVTLLVSSAAIETRPLSAASNLKTGDLSVFDTTAQGFNAPAASSAVTDKEILATITPYFRKLSPSDVTHIYYTLRQPRYLGEEVLKQGYLTGSRNFAEALHQIYLIPQFENLITRLTAENIIDLPTLREGFKTNPHFWASALSSIRDHFEEFHAGVSDLTSHGFDLQAVRTGFAESPSRFVKQVLGLRSMKYSQRLTVMDLMKGLGDINGLLKEKKRVIAMRIYNVSSLNAAEGFIKIFNLNAKSRVLLEYPRNSVMKDVIAQRLPGYRSREIIAQDHIWEVRVEFKDDIDLPLRENAGQLSLPKKFFKYDLQDPVSAQEVAQMRQALDLPAGRKVIVTTIASSEDQSEIKRILDAQARFAGPERPLLILGLRRVDDAAREFLKSYPSLKFLERGPQDYVPGQPFNGLAQGQPMKGADVIVLNTIGELLKLYALSDVPPFVGNDRNIAEPISQGKYTVFLDVNWINNKKVRDFFAGNGAAEAAQGDLYAQFKNWLDHPEEVSRLNERAAQAIKKYREANFSTARFNTVAELVLKINSAPRQSASSSVGDSLTQSDFGDWEQMTDFFINNGGAPPGWWVGFDVDKATDIDGNRAKRKVFEKLNSLILSKFGATQGVRLFKTNQSQLRYLLEEGYVYLPDILSKEQLEQELEGIRLDFIEQTRDSKGQKNETVTFAVLNSQDIQSAAISRYGTTKEAHFPNPVLQAQRDVTKVLDEMLREAKGLKGAAKDINYGNKTVFYAASSAVKNIQEKIDTTAGELTLNFSVSDVQMPQISRKGQIFSADVSPLKDIVSRIINQELRISLLPAGNKAVFVESLAVTEIDRLFLVTWGSKKYVIKVANQGRNNFLYNEWEILAHLNMSDAPRGDIVKPLFVGQESWINESDLSRQKTEYIVTNYLDGEDLSDIIRRKPLTVPQVLKLGIELSDTIGYVHSREVSVRDLKPNNIRILSDGRAALFDFNASVPDDYDWGEDRYELKWLEVSSWTAEDRRVPLTKRQKPDVLFDIYAIGMTLLRSAIPTFYWVDDIKQGDASTDQVAIEEMLKDLGEKNAELRTIIAKAVGPRETRYKNTAELKADLLALQQSMPGGKVSASSAVFSLAQLTGPQEWIPAALATKIEKLLNQNRPLGYIDFEVNDQNGSEQLIDRLKGFSGDQYVALLVKGEALAGAKAFHVVVDRKDVLVQQHNLETILDVREAAGMYMSKFVFVETYRVYPAAKTVQNTLMDFNSFYSDQTGSIAPNKNPEFAGWGYFILQTMARNLKKYFPDYYLLDEPLAEAPSIGAWLKNNFNDPGFPSDTPEWIAVLENSVRAYSRVQGFIGEPLKRNYVVRKIPDLSASSAAEAVGDLSLPITKLSSRSSIVPVAIRDIGFSVSFYRLIYDKLNINKENPRFLFIGGTLNEIIPFLENYPTAEISIVALEDRSLNAIREAYIGKPEANRIHLYQGDASSLDPEIFPSESFDLIYAAGIDDTAYPFEPGEKPENRLKRTTDILQRMAREEVRLLAVGGVLYHEDHSIQFIDKNGTTIIKEYYPEALEGGILNEERFSPNKGWALHRKIKSASSGVNENVDVGLGTDGLGTSSDVASSVGGIDLTEKNMNLDLRGQAGTFTMPADPAQVQSIHIDGLVPVILNVTPLPSLPAFLKLSEAQTAEPAQLSLQN